MSNKFRYDYSTLPVMGSCPTPSKRGYGLRSSAEMALDNTKNYSHSDRRKERRVYPCRCGQYHLTSMKEAM